MELRPSDSTKGAEHPEVTSDRQFWALVIGSTGVVYGDIGTSPLYAFREAIIAAKAASFAGRDALPEVLASMVARPWRWIPVVFTLDKALYLVTMLAPLGFLPLAAPRAAAAALPGLALNLLSTDAVLIQFRTQYQAFVLPFLMLAAVEGFAVVREAAWWPRRLPVRAVVVAAAIAALVLASRTANDLGVRKWGLRPEHHAMHALLARVPPRVPVSVNERFVPHLATRAEVYIFPTGVERAVWVLDLESSIARADVSRFEVVARDRGWALLRRAG